MRCSAGSATCSTTGRSASTTPPSSASPPPSGPAACCGLTPQQIVHAIGIHVAGAVALNQTRVGTLSNWKAGAAADAARTAIFAVELAQGGMTGPAQVFEGPDGFFSRINRKPFGLPQARRRRRAVRNHALLHQALHARPVRPDGRAGGGRGARVLHRRRRDRAGEHPGVAQGDRGHGGLTRQMAPADARDRRPQHALCGRRGADVRHGRRAALRRPLSARPAPSGPRRPRALPAVRRRPSPSSRR